MHEAEVGNSCGPACPCGGVWEDDGPYGGPSRVLRRLSDLADRWERLRQGLDRLGRADVPISGVRVETAEDAMAAGFAGSPTILVDGRDLFPQSIEWTGGLGCRLYWTPGGIRWDSSRGGHHGCAERKGVMDDDDDGC